MTVHLVQTGHCGHLHTVCHCTTLICVVQAQAAPAAPPIATRWFTDDYIGYQLRPTSDTLAPAPLPHTSGRP